MRKTMIMLALFLAPTLLSSCSKSNTTGSGANKDGMIKPAAAPAGMARADDSDPELINAKVQAQNTLPEFKAAFAKRTPEQKFAIKAPFKEGVNEEHKWVIVDAVRKDETDGHVERPSAVIKHLKTNLVITVNDYNIEDWAYTDKDGKQHGGYSVEVLRKREAQAK